MKTTAKSKPCYGPCHVCNVPDPAENTLHVGYASLPKILKKARNKCETCNGNRFILIPSSEPARTEYYNHFKGTCESCNTVIPICSMKVCADSTGWYNLCSGCEPDWKRDGRHGKINPQGK